MMYLNYRRHIRVQVRGRCSVYLIASSISRLNFQSIHVIVHTNGPTSCRARHHRRQFGTTSLPRRDIQTTRCSRASYLYRLRIYTLGHGIQLTHGDLLIKKPNRSFASSCPTEISDHLPRFPHQKAISTIYIQMKIILTGSSGFIGTEVLTQAISNPDITSILVLSRKPLPEQFTSNSKVNVVIIEDLTSYTPEVLKQLERAEGCVW